MKNNKGITLIVLIITVIIMLILVAVVIDITIDGKLIDNAKSAVDQTNEKVTQTQARVDELMGELTEVAQSQCSHTYSNGVCTKCGEACSHSFANWVCTRCGIEVEPIQAGVRTNEKAIFRSGTEIAIIPKGFKVSEVATEQTIEDGLVIIDDDENEFVWIPLHNGDINTMFMCQEHTTSTLAYNEATGKITCSECGTDCTKLCGKLYFTTSGR